jgi:hypothetical protein
LLTRVPRAQKKRPRNLADLELGKDVPGDCGSSPTVPPPWFDKEKYGTTKAFFEQHGLTLV